MQNRSERRVIIIIFFSSIYLRGSAVHEICVSRNVCRTGLGRAWVWSPQMRDWTAPNCLPCKPKYQSDNWKLMTALSSNSQTDHQTTGSTNNHPKLPTVVQLLAKNCSWMASEYVCSAHGVERDWWYLEQFDDGHCEARTLIDDHRTTITRQWASAEWSWSQKSQSACSRSKRPVSDASYQNRACVCDVQCPLFRLYIGRGGTFDGSGNSRRLGNYWDNLWAYAHFKYGDGRFQSKFQDMDSKCNRAIDRYTLELIYDLCRDIPRMHPWYNNNWDNCDNGTNALNCFTVVRQFIEWFSDQWLASTVEQTEWTKESDKHVLIHPWSNWTIYGPSPYTGCRNGWTCGQLGIESTTIPRPSLGSGIGNYSQPLLCRLASTASARAPGSLSLQWQPTSQP